MRSIGVVTAGFEHGIVINVDGEDYYLAGAPDGPNGEYDVPGHSWNMAGPKKLVGKHYNTGPFGASQWWSSDAPDGEYLYKVDGIIDVWTQDKADRYSSRGFIHYHELIRVSDGTLHPTKVVWLKHTARTSFDFDAGPHPEFGHYVTPGVDYEFMPNWSMPYSSRRGFALRSQPDLPPGLSELSICSSFHGQDNECLVPESTSSLKKD